MMVADSSLNRWPNSNLHNLFQDATFDERKRTGISCQTKHCLSSAANLQAGERMIDGRLVSVVKLSN